MTPEITWTHRDWATLEAWYDGELWVLLKKTRRDQHGPAGWYLHATEGAAVLDVGRFVDSRVKNAPYKATTTILTEKITQLQGALDATDRIEKATAVDVAAALAAIRKYDDPAKAAEILSDLLVSLGGEGSC